MGYFGTSSSSSPYPLPDSLVYNVYKVVHTPHHPPPHGYDIDLYNPPPHHIKAVQPTTSSHQVVQPMWTRWSVCELVIRPSLYVCVIFSRDQ